MGRLKEKIENLESNAHVVHTTAKQVISRLGKNENAVEMYRNEKSFAEGGSDAEWFKSVEDLKSKLSWVQGPLLQTGDHQQELFQCK